jgi:RNA polymerase primary sigma factor
LHRLPEREAHILRLRYGLEDGETHTLEEVGKQIGVTRERVRQLEAQALNRLRRSSAHTLLIDYLR